MGTQSNTHPPRASHAPLPIALLLLFSLTSTHAAPAQTASVSAITVPLVLPSAIVFDAVGNLYLAETGNHVIRKVDSAGNITTIAGTGTQGFSGDNGPATSATLDSPQGLALDTQNNLYIADTHNHRIRKLNLTTGKITTIAGTGTLGFSGENALATSAQLALPAALALDASNNLYLADTGNHRIRKITVTTGVITTFAGNATQGFSGDNALATAATALSAAGTYSITATLNGPAAGNYAIPSPVATLTIKPAATFITLSANATTGSSITLTAHVASTTTGTPTGSVTLLDGSVTLATTPLSTTGDAVFTIPSITQGAHSFTALYAGSTNFAPSVSAPQLITGGTGSPDTSDFALTPTGTTTQTIPSGSSADYTFTVQL